MGGYLLLQLHLLAKGGTTLADDDVTPVRTALGADAGPLRHYFFGPAGEFLGRVAGVGARGAAL